MNWTTDSITGFTAFTRAALVALCASGALLWAQPTLKITSPEEGAVVYAGEDLPVAVEASPPNAFQIVTLIPTFFRTTADMMLRRPPYRFSIKVSPRLSPRQYSLTADGIVKPGEGASSDPVGIQIERRETPLSLRAQPDFIVFRAVGDEIPLDVMGRFVDEENVTLDQSTFIKFASDNTTVATVDSDGHVKGVGLGSAKITIDYKGMSAVVQVTVGRPPAQKR